jgi:hypothetical protein
MLVTDGDYKFQLNNCKTQELRIQRYPHGVVARFLHAQPLSLFPQTAIQGAGCIAKAKYLRITKDAF